MRLIRTSATRLDLVSFLRARPETHLPSLRRLLGSSGSGYVDPLPGSEALQFSFWTSHPEGLSGVSGQTVRSMRETSWVRSGAALCAVPWRGAGRVSLRPLVSGPTRLSIGKFGVNSWYVEGEVRAMIIPARGNLAGARSTN